MGAFSQSNILLLSTMDGCQFMDEAIAGTQRTMGDPTRRWRCEVIRYTNMMNM